MRASFAFSTALVVVCATAVGAPMTIVPTSTEWTSTGNSGGGSSAITMDQPGPGAGDGSIRMVGDRTRFFHQLATPVALSSLNAFSFDWFVDESSWSPLGAHVTPAFRLHIMDGSQSSELIWEGVYNGIQNVTEGEWFSTDAFADSQVFWRWVTGSGVTLDGGSQANLTIGDWSTPSWYTGNAQIVGISTGVGSSAGSNYVAYADNISYGVNGQEAVAFEFAATAVPEPSTLLLAGLGGLGLIGFRRRRRATA